MLILHEVRMLSKGLNRVLMYDYTINSLAISPTVSATRYRPNKIMKVFCESRQMAVDHCPPGTFPVSKPGPRPLVGVQNLSYVGFKILHRPLGNMAHVTNLHIVLDRIDNPKVDAIHRVQLFKR